VILLYCSYIDLDHRPLCGVWLLSVNNSTVSFSWQQTETPIRHSRRPRGQLLCHALRCPCIRCGGIKGMRHFLTCWGVLLWGPCLAEHSACGWLNSLLSMREKILREKLTKFTLRLCLTSEFRGSPVDSLRNSQSRRSAQSSWKFQCDAKLSRAGILCRTESVTDGVSHEWWGVPSLSPEPPETDGMGLVIGPWLSPSPYRRSVPEQYPKSITHVFLWLPRRRGSCQLATDLLRTC